MMTKVNMDPADYLRLPYARVVRPDKAGGYSAEILEFRGCVAEGDTTAEALANLERVAESWIEACLEQGLEVPPPIDEPVFSGKIALRLPRSLHQDAARYADADDVSLNQFIVTAVAEKVGRASSWSNILTAASGPYIGTAGRPGIWFTKRMTTFVGSQITGMSATTFSAADYDNVVNYLGYATSATEQQQGPSEGIDYWTSR